MMIVAKVLALFPCIASAWSGWKVGERAAPDEDMTVHLMLRHPPSAIEKLERTLVTVSDPRSALYGKHLSLEQVKEMMPVDDNHRRVVAEWLVGETGVRQVLPNHNGDVVAVTLTAAAAEHLFATRIHRFRHPSTGDAVLLRATSSYTLPQPVAAAVAAVADLVGLPKVDTSIRSVSSMETKPVSTMPNSCNLRDCAGKITPGALKQLYNIPEDSTGMTASGNSMAVAEFCPLGSGALGLQCQYFSPADIAEFSDKCHVNATVDTVIGPNKPDVPWGSGVESLLDIEFTRGLADAIPLTVIFQKKYSIAAWVHTLSSMSQPPLVHSISWGTDEFQNGTDEGNSDIGYMQAINVQFMQAGVRGVSILAATGDSGVCAIEGCGWGAKKRYHADFPASSPYVTSVGGTELARRGELGDEKVWPSSGGGFSDAFAVADFQREAVAAYKTNSAAKLPSVKLWNSTGRGYPDLSALAVDYCEVGTAGGVKVSGTSAASPVTAAVFARLNGLRLAAGKPPLGWLNPFIYQNGNAFNDVTQGRNGGSIFSWDGFTATEGWDPASGWGTPNFKALAQRVSALGPEVQSSFVV
mmetsp:Transcript_129338/g.258237  ORF Transcript_129338/g.258237 Transcript_129338/m.258237 type:complete len:583 (+) Transcript_129338:84-1832(+)